MFMLSVSLSLGEEREVRRQNHCSPATGLALWEGEASSVHVLFSFLEHDGL